MSHGLRAAQGTRHFVLSDNLDQLVMFPLSQIHCSPSFPRAMNAEGELDRFQRWLQSRLADAEKIESVDERLRTSNRIQNAIQECINFRQAINVQQTVANPFVTRDKPVRAVNESEVKPVSSITGICNKCEAELTGDLEFCPLCGEYQ